MLTIIPHDALVGDNLNIIGEKLNIMEKKGTAKPNQDNTINPTAESEVDIDEQARLHY